MKTSILILPLFLTGCFMYDNLKQGFECSLDQTKCNEIIMKTESDMLNEAIITMETRCSKTYKLKKGTIEYMDCQERLKNCFDVMANHYGMEEAAGRFTMMLSLQETKCYGYGMKDGTKNFNICLAKLENRDINQIFNNISLEKAQNRAAMQAFGQSLNSFSATMQQQNEAMVTRSLGGISCSSQTINGITRTNCR